jgi:hypothetical protein
LDESSELIKNLLEVGTVYHSLLFSYQRGLKRYMGSRANIYVNPAIEHLLEMDEEGGLKLEKSKTFEEAVSAFSDFLARSKIVKNCTLEKVDEGKYVFRVEGCVWAGKVHTRQVSLKDVTCPYALVAMALYKKYKGFVSSENDSEYFYNGTETILEPASY